MHLIVGLGNPGDEYAHTRHNAGFDTLDALAESLKVTYWKKACGGLLAEARLPQSLGGEEVVLLKPLSFMNLSGGPVKKALTTYGLGIDDLIVIHDELDIPAGALRVKVGGGHAGHNGLRSICDKCGSRDFARIRVGIGRPPGRMDVAAYVLSRPKKDELALFEDACQEGAQAILYFLENGLEKTQQQFNRSR